MQVDASALIDVPQRVVSAVLTETAGYQSALAEAGLRVSAPHPVLAPGAEVTVHRRWVRLRFRVVEATVDGVRAVLVGGPLPAAEVSVRLTGTRAGVRLTCSIRLRSAAGLVSSRRLRAISSALATRFAGRAGELAGARVVVGAAVLGTGRLLAQQRAYPPEAAGRWELPGGRVEPGESDVDAVRRECAEELGVAVVVGDPVGPDVLIKEGWLLRSYRARLVGPTEPHPHDHRALRWLTAGTLGSVDWLPADRVLLPALRALLRAGR